MRKENTNIVYFIMLFFFGSISGWLWEMIAFKFTHDGFGWIEIIQNLRGVLHGPWVPIYGFGFILLVLLGQRLKQRPVILLFSSIVACAFLVMAFLADTLIALKFPNLGMGVSITGGR